ncbi:hypothetical protein QCA50_018964 [Cerrena zonata]|uniref:Uncharacterized protein n=1 Tax=Cerrena zonata TaxID=2478898 RepID=A0AAW0FIN7_9APHY
MPSTVAYPPIAHTTTDRSNPIVSAQPRPAAGMIPQKGTQNDDGKAQRLRGGCIPCPVRISRQRDDNGILMLVLYRTEASAGSYLVVAAAKRT